MIPALYPALASSEPLKFVPRQTPALSPAGRGFDDDPPAAAPAVLTPAGEGSSSALECDSTDPPGADLRGGPLASGAATFSLRRPEAPDA